MADEASSTPPDDLYTRLARALAPSYEMETEIGRGGMAIVYRARDTRLKRGVAVKLLPPELAFRSDIRQRFLREAETAARLSHPNIVPIYTVDERDGLVYFVMALVQGGSVGDRLRRERALPVDDVRRIMREVASALAYAHRNGVVHRDIKPDNVLLDSDSGRSMVTDFGIARAADDSGDGSRLTATGAAIGTPAYMSPEQCAGDRDLDGRSDLYSLGTVAYHMLVGEPPFTGNNTPSVMMKQVTERPVSPRVRRPDVPPDLEKIIMKLLEKDPANRFNDGDAVVSALEGASFVTPPSMAAPSRVDPAIGPLAQAFTRRMELRDEKIARAQAKIAEVQRRLGVAQTRLAMETGSSRFEVRLARREARRAKRHGDRDDPTQPLDTRVKGFRRQFASWIGTSAFLVGINAMTNGPRHHFWWSLFAVFGIGIGVVTRAGSLWADGVGLKEMFSGRPQPLPQAPDTPALPANVNVPGDAGAQGITQEVLAGQYGAVLKQAMADRKTALDLIGRLSENERKMIPDAQPTADALYERIVALAGALHRLDGQMSGERIAGLDERISKIEGESGDATDRERRLNLLKRQRETLVELRDARASLLEQYESAGILLQNLTLDLLKVRSSGLDSALSGITSATQEARALSREIGYVLDAAKDLEKL